VEHVTAGKEHLRLPQPERLQAYGARLRLVTAAAISATTSATATAGASAAALLPRRRLLLNRKPLRLRQPRRRRNSRRRRRRRRGRGKPLLLAMLTPRPAFAATIPRSTITTAPSAIARGTGVALPAAPKGARLGLEEQRRLDEGSLVDEGRRHARYRGRLEAGPAAAVPRAPRIHCPAAPARPASTTSARTASPDSAAAPGSGWGSGGRVMTLTGVRAYRGRSCCGSGCGR